MKIYVRTSALSWADKLVELTFFSMQTYLTDVWGLSFTHAAAILNFWRGITKILPLSFVFLAEALTGHFKVIVIASIACSLGIAFVTMSIPPVLANSTGTCKEYDARCVGHTQKVLFFTGMALLALGFSGHRACVGPFTHEQQKEAKLSRALSILRHVIACSVTLVVITWYFAFPYIKQWYLLFGIPGIFVVSATLFFFSWWNTYNCSKPQGSPLSDVCRVFVAAALKISQPIDTNHLYKINDDNPFPTHRFPRCLEKAAIILPAQESVQCHSRWRLCSIDKVEAAKFVARVIPIGATFIVCTIVSSVGNTFIVEQGSHMNRNLGKWKIPSQLLVAIFFLVKLYFRRLADRLLGKSGPQKFGPLQGIVVAMIFSVLCCVTASVIEIERLKSVKHHDGADKVVTMNAYWLLFPFVLLAGLDSFLAKSVEAFYMMESPKAVAAYCMHFADVVSGMGLMYSVLSVYVAGKLSEIGGRQNWFQDVLNKSRLDLYYWVLAALGAINLLIFIPLAPLYYHPIQGANDEGQVVGDDSTTNTIV